MVTGNFILFLAAMTMSGSDDNVVAFFSSESGGNSRSNENIASSASSESVDIPRLQAANPNKKLPTIKLGESIRFEEWGYV